MNNLLIIISIVFVITTLLTIWQFYNASGKSTKVIVFVLAWLIIQGIIGLSGFYQVSQAFPPRLVLLVGPGILLSVLLLISKSGRTFADRLDIRKLTLLHAVRVPVEITLYYIYAARLIPISMTFEGNNFDILSGLTAPIIYYLVFVRKKLNNSALLAWNVGCLALLINILVIAILSAQTPFQKLAFDQPNTGVTYFPFVWLPAVIVPIVLVSHFAAIRQLIISRKQITSTVVDHSLNLVK